jgi:hypothetical protein
MDQLSNRHFLVDTCTSYSIFSHTSAAAAAERLSQDPDLPRGNIPKTAIATSFGLLDFLRMIFGPRNVGNTFQRLMDWVLAGQEFVFIYLDDVIISSRSMSEQVQHVWIFFQGLQADGLVINREKCVIGVSEVDFLGATGFLDVINFYRCFIPATAHILKQLTD